MAPQRTPGLLEPHINSVSISEPQTVWVNFKLDTQTADTLNYRRSRDTQPGCTVLATQVGLPLAHSLTTSQPTLIES